MEFLCLFQTQWKHTKCKIRKCWYGTDLRLVLVVQQLKRWPINRSLVITDFCPTMTLAIACSAIKQHFTQCTALFVKGWSTSWWQGLWISVAEILPQMPPPPNCQHQLSPEVTNPTNQLKKVQDKVPWTWRDDTNRNFLFSSPTSLFPQVARCHLTPSGVQLSHWVFMSSPLTIETPLISFNVDIFSKQYVCNRCTFSAFFGHFLQVIVKVTLSLLN